MKIQPVFGRGKENIKTKHTHTQTWSLFHVSQLLHMACPGVWLITQWHSTGDNCFPQQSDLDLGCLVRAVTALGAPVSQPCCVPGVIPTSVSYSLSTSVLFHIDPWCFWIFNNRNQQLSLARIALLTARCILPFLSCEPLRFSPVCRCHLIARYFSCPFYFSYCLFLRLWSVLVVTTFCPLLV